MWGVKQIVLAEEQGRELNAQNFNFRMEKTRKEFFTTEIRVKGEVLFERRCKLVYTYTVEPT